MSMDYGLIGYPLCHSFSAELHAKAGNYEYSLIELKGDELKEFFGKRDFKGINVTLPYKSAVIPFLDCIDESAKRIGAVNTVINKNGLLYGYNTDILGMQALINKCGIELCGKKVAILGSGGTSKTAFATAKELGAGEIITVSRHKKANAVTYDELYKNHKDTEVIINTTPVGMFPDNGGMPLDISGFDKLCGVLDAVYNPLRTKLVLEAKKRGIKAAGGLYMLVSQGVYASKLFCGAEINGDDIYKEIKRDKQNIVLCGMPSCGKSTVGRLLSEVLCKPFYDVDTEIENREKMSAFKIITKKGEEYFRKAEKEVIRELSAKSGIVIALGGGSVLERENTDNLKQNGRVYFIDRPPQLLTPTPDRPLASSKEAINELYQKRHKTYIFSADVTVSGNLTAEDFANKIREDFLNEDSCY